jgi:hypothetical protein
MPADAAQRVADKGTTMTDDRNAGTKPGETAREKTERLRAARLQAEQDKDARIERANRKAAARRKVLGKP